MRPYVAEFGGRHNVKKLDTIDQMKFVARGFIGRKLPYKVLAG